MSGGILVPTDTAHALHVYLVEWEKYPEQAQAAMDSLADVLTTEFEEQRRVDAAEAVAASDKRSASAEAHRMTFGKAAVPTSIGLAVGVIFGAWLESRR